MLSAATCRSGSRSSEHAPAIELTSKENPDFKLSIPSAKPSETQNLPIKDCGSEGTLVARIRTCEKVNGRASMVAGGKPTDLPTWRLVYAEGERQLWLHLRTQRIWSSSGPDAEVSCEKQPKIRSGRGSVVFHIPFQADYLSFFPFHWPQAMVHHERVFFRYQDLDEAGSVANEALRRFQNHPLGEALWTRCVSSASSG